MNPTTLISSPASLATREHAPVHARRVIVLATIGWAGAMAACAAISAPWLAAPGIALGMFLALKVSTLQGCHHDGASGFRILGYLLLWPGMNARTFLRTDSPTPPAPSRLELAAAFAKLALGVVLVSWAVMHASTAPRRLVGAVGLSGVICTFHFGLFHVLSWAWRRVGICAPPLMRAPIAARSLAEFWSERWNTAFAEIARRFVLRPLARRWGVRLAGVAVFLVSGVVHEIAISLPARGGWGGPTLYFLLQAAGLGVEKNPSGRRLGLGAGIRGRVWTVLFTAAPLPLLFHPPLIERVVVPLFRFLEEAL